MDLPQRTSGYAFDNEKPEGEKQLRYLSEILDPHTKQILSGAGATTGKRCWDIGSGVGTVATWLANKVGPTGYVLASDIKPKHIRPVQNLEVLEHDLRTDPLPSGGFDIVHARLLFMHLPTRESLMRRLVTVLNPGGTLVVSDWETSYVDLVLDSPNAEGARVFRKFLEACLEGSYTVGIDPRWARRSHGVMRASGLSGVSTVAHAQSWVGGSPGCLLHRSNSIQLESGFKELGMTDDELENLREVLLEPRFVTSSYLMWTTCGIND